MGWHAYVATRGWGRKAQAASKHQHIVGCPVTEAYLTYLNGMHCACAEKTCARVHFLAGELIPLQCDGIVCPNPKVEDCYMVSSSFTPPVSAACGHVHHKQPACLLACVRACPQPHPCCSRSQPLRS